MAGIVNFRDANLNQSSEENSSLWTPNNMDGSNWSVATGRASAQGGAVDKSTGIGGATIAIAVVGLVAVALLLRHRKG
jgi:uncharacterized protein (TIGR03382 family)